MFSVRRSSKAVRFSSPVQGPCRRSSRGYRTCDLITQAKQSVVCGLCLVPLLSHLGEVLRPLTSWAEATCTLTYPGLGFRWDSGGRVLGLNPFGLGKLLDSVFLIC